MQMKMSKKPSDGTNGDAELGGRIRKTTMAHIVATSEKVFAQAGFNGVSMCRMCLRAISCLSA